MTKSLLSILTIFTLLFSIQCGRPESNYSDTDAMIDSDYDITARHNGGGGTTTYSCTDTDGGVNLLVKGTTTTYTTSKGKQNINSTATDSCPTVMGVNEYRCDGSSIPQVTGEVCVAGSCINGACVPAVTSGADTSAPTVTLTQPINDTSYCATNGYMLFYVVASDNFGTPPASGVTFYIDGVANTSAVATAYGFNISGFPEPGSHTVYARVCDAAGNCANTATVNFRTSMCGKLF